MQKHKPTPAAIVHALGVRRLLLEKLEGISPNIYLLDEEPETLPKRLAATYREIARMAMSACHELEPADEELPDARMTRLLKERET